MEKEQLEDFLNSLKEHYSPEELVSRLNLESFVNSKSVLSKPAILRAMKNKELVIDPFNMQNLANTSYDVTLGKHFYREVPNAGILNPYDEASVRKIWQKHEAIPAREAQKGMNSGEWKNIGAEEKVILIKPGEMILGHTNEYIGGKESITTMMKARSSLGRNFIAVCKCAGWGDASYFNRWTMEITNHSQSHSIPLVVGRRIAQIVFLGVEKVDARDNYFKSGKYQNNADLADLKKNWTPDAMIPKMWKDWEVRT